MAEYSPLIHIPEQNHLSCLDYCIAIGKIVIVIHTNTGCCVNGTTYLKSACGHFRQLKSVLT